MKNTARANHINGTKRQSPQVKTPNRSAAPSAPQVETQPGEYLLACKTALENLEHSGRSAVALCLMNSHTIHESINAFAGWEDLDIPNMREGVVSLARDVAFQFESARAKYRNYVMALPRHSDGQSGYFKMEESINALKQLLEGQSYLLGRTQHFGFGVGNLAAAGRLQQAFEISWDANTNLQIDKNSNTANGQPGEVVA